MVTHLTTGKRKIVKMNILRLPLARATLALIFVLLVGVVFNANGAFFNWETHRDMLRHISVYAVLACGMTVVILTAGIDLSVGSVLGFSAVLFSILIIQKGFSPFLSIPLVLLTGLGCGLLSGGLIARFRLQPFIATLAMMVLARGLAKWVSGGKKISTAVLDESGVYRYIETPPIFELLSSKIFQSNLAVVTLVFLICAACCSVLLNKTRWGRYLYAVGGNEEAARLSGVPVARTKLLAYGLSGLFSAVAGICQAAQEMQGDPEAGMAYELTAIAIVVIGGTSLAGGRGSIGLTIVGALTIGYLEKILSLNAIGEASRLMLTGVIIIVAVLFQSARK